MTGVFDGNYRVSSNYRSQWKSISNPYKTYSASYDMSLFRKEKNGGLGVGIYFYNDKAGTSNMGQTLAAMTLAYNAALNNENYLSAGIMTAYVQRSLSFDNLRWVNQFDGVNYNQNIPSGEQNIVGSFTYYDIAGGLLWTHIPSSLLRANAGLSFSHNNRPNGSYYLITTNRLSPKFVLHGELQNTLQNTNITIIPRFFLAFQQSSKEMVAGMLLKHSFGMTSKDTELLKSSAIYFGGFYRWDDALILNFIAEYKNNLSLGISYDINTSPLSIASYGRGGIEISLIQKGFFKKNATVTDTSTPRFGFLEKNGG